MYTYIPIRIYANLIALRVELRISESPDNSSEIRIYNLLQIGTGTTFICEENRGPRVLSERGGSFNGLRCMAVTLFCKTISASFLLPY